MSSFKKILITGKNGYVSTKLSKWLIERYNINTDNISLRNDGWREKDFSGYDVLVHVAGLVPKSGVLPHDFYEVNSELTKKIAAKAKKSGVKQFVYLSSMAVYGITQSLEKGGGVVTEGTPCNAQEDYGKSKKLAEDCLSALADDCFKVAIVRVPSIYGEGKSEYLDRYKRFFDKFYAIPYVFTDKYKSVIYIDNLCELIYLIIENNGTGVFCPDDGEISAVGIYRAIERHKRKSCFLGFMARLFKKKTIITEYFGALCYDNSLTNVFDGKYRIVDYKTAIERIYGK